MSDEPRLRVSFLGPALRVAPGHWQCAWAISNDGAEPFVFTSAWLPHARFRSERVELTPGWEVPPGQSVTLNLEASADEPPGTVVENPFVLLTIEAAEQAWRVFARLFVHFGEDGTPEPRSQGLTLAAVGFASS